MEIRYESRRDFLKKVASTTIGLTLSGCVDFRREYVNHDHTLNTPGEASEYAHAPRLSEYKSGLNKLRGHSAAAGILIGEEAKSEENLDNFKFNGHGGLFNINGSLWLVTVEHVIRENTGSISAILPGVSGLFKINDIKKARRLSMSVINNGGVDGIIAYPIPTNTTNLNERIEEDRIKPLQIKTTPIAAGQSLGIVNPDGEITQLKHAGVARDESTMNTDIRRRMNKFEIMDRSKICAGQSGSPLLVLNERGSPTGEAIGILVEVTTRMKMNNDAKIISVDECGRHEGNYIPFY